MSVTNNSEPEMTGWLFKWTNYLKGYQKRWFVLSNGLLSYYRNQMEVSPTMCRGTIILQDAYIHTVNSCMFIISNGGTQTFHIKASNEIERQRWVTTLELAKTKAITALESEEDVEDFNNDQKCEITSIMKNLSIHLENINKLINNHRNVLETSLLELETLDSAEYLPEKIETIKEKITSFRISADALINSCSEYGHVAQAETRKLQKLLKYERNQKLCFEKMVEELARQHNVLEQTAKCHRLHKPKNPLSDDDGDSSEFYDCEESINSSSITQNFLIKIPSFQRRLSLKNIQIKEAECSPVEASGSSSDVEEAKETEVVVIAGDPQENTSTPNKIQISSSLNKSVNTRQRRTRVPNKPDYPLTLWNILKNCVGKELSKIPMPVNFSEPLSMLQRLTEDYEYSYILDYAANLTDSEEQLAYVAAFTISSYSTTSNRTGKPFNPLLGETYECDRRDDLGWRLISEQVSHHPPIVAQHCEGREWTCWQEFTMSTKFRGKYLQVIPLGTVHLQFHSSGNHYTWRKVTTTIHNIIVGKLWVDQHGQMDIINHRDGSKCSLSYIPHTYFNRDIQQRKVEGCVMDKNGKVCWIVNGFWDSKVEVAPVTNVEGTSDDPIYKTGPYSLVWERHPPLSDSYKYYNFTEFACQLNEPEEGVAPTDSRGRPDQRLMEEGKWDEANALKIQLEEKQRAARKRRKPSRDRSTSGDQPNHAYQPAWFKAETEPISGKLIHVFKGDYWICKEKGDWSRCPNIF